MTTINLTDNNISDLIDILDKLSEKNLYLYWLIQEQKDKLKYINKDESIKQILEHYKNQISKMYMLNILEQNILNIENTQLNTILLKLKDILNNGEIMDSSIINGLYISNLETIFNNIDDYEYDYKLEAPIELKENNLYINSALEYANSFNKKRKTRKKILNIV